MATDWRKYLNAELRKVAAQCARQEDRVLNVGTTQDYQDQEGMKYADYFSEQIYITADKHVGEDTTNHWKCGVEEIEGSAGMYRLVLLMNVLEHVENPFQVAEAAVKLVDPGGHIFITVPFFYRRHFNAYMKDYWRFTPDTLRLLFSPFAKEKWIKSCPPAEKQRPTGYIGLFER